MNAPINTANPPLTLNKGRKIKIWVFILAIIIIIGGFAYGFIELGKVNLNLAKKVTLLDSQAANNKQAIDQLQSAINTMAASQQKAVDLTAEQAKLIDDWHKAAQNDLEKWRVAEAQYLVKLADTHLTFTHDYALAAVLLQRAISILNDLKDPALDQIIKALTGTSATLQAMPALNTTDLFMQLSAFNETIDDLSLPKTPLADVTNTVAVDNPNAAWWRRGLHQTWVVLSKIVIVKKNTSPDSPLVLPEEKMFLYQHLHVQVENAQWALLHRDAKVYGISLNNIAHWIKTYFVADAKTTQALEVIAGLQQKTDLAPPIDLTSVETQFDTYLTAKPV